MTERKIGNTVGVIDVPLDEAILREFLPSGIEYVEAAIPPNVNVSQLAWAQRAFSEAGLEVWSVHAPFQDDLIISSPDRGGRRAGMDAVVRSAEACMRLGGSVVVVHASVMRVDGQSDKKAVRTATESMRRVLDRTSHMDVRFALENMLPGHPTTDMRNVAQIVDDLNDDRVGICVDTGHGHVAGDAVRAVELAGERIITTHLHDNDTTWDVHALPGDGTINWRDVGAAFASAGYEGPLMFEVRPYEELEGLLPRFRAAAEMVQGHMRKRTST